MSLPCRYHVTTMSLTWEHTSVQIVQLLVTGFYILAAANVIRHMDVLNPESLLTAKSGFDVQS